MNVRDLKERLAELGPELELLPIKYVERGAGPNNSDIEYDIDVVVVNHGRDVTLGSEG